MNVILYVAKRPQQILLIAIMVLFSLNEARADKDQSKKDKTSLPNPLIVLQVIRICRYGSICPTESHVFLKIPTIRENTASILSDRTMSDLRVIADRT